MKKISYILTITIALLTTMSCEDVVEGINENPNDIIISEVEFRLFLTGSMIANVQLQCGHLNRISGMYSGQLIGFSSLYSNIYGYNLSTAESNGEWNALYVGVITNMRHIISNSTNAQLVGIAKVVEAHAVGTGASLFGDIPYSETGNPEISDPVFDPQVDVYTSVIALLDDAISTLSSANSGNLSEDIYFGGDTTKWIEAANTLKARFYLHQKNYPAAMAAAQNGISSDDGDVKYRPGGAASGDKNLFWTILEGARAGDIGNNNTGTESYLIQILDATNPLSRNHAKTNEAARRGYFSINSSSGSANDGIVQQQEPQNMVTFFENELIMAEAAARAGDVSDGLPFLNNVRAWMNTGAHVNSNYQAMPLLYDAFVTTDFDNGGIENTDNIDSKTAFLREVIEERYVSGFGMHMPYNDARRLRKSDTAFEVPFVLIDGPAPPYPERMPYSTSTINSNSNAPSDDPGIFVKTAVNQ